MSAYVRVGPRPRMRFGGVEVTQILIAVAAMTVAFALSALDGVYGIEDNLRLGGPIWVALVLLASFVAVVTAFLLHELAHKAVAQRFGCFAEFRYFPMGLALGVLTGAFGYLFAMPGAVMISGQVGPRENVRISAAGPGTNMALGAGFLGLALALGGAANPLANIASFFIGFIAQVNLFLAGFNLLPFPPLDGSKVFAFNRVLWVGMIAGTVALYALGWWLRGF